MYPTFAIYLSYMYAVILSIDLLKKRSNMYKCNILLSFFSHFVLIAEKLQKIPPFTENLEYLSVQKNFYFFIQMDISVPTALLCHP